MDTTIHDIMFTACSKDDEKTIRLLVKRHNLKYHDLKEAMVLAYKNNSINVVYYVSKNMVKDVSTILLAACEHDSTHVMSHLLTRFKIGYNVMEKILLHPNINKNVIACIINAMTLENATTLLIRNIQFADYYVKRVSFEDLRHRNLEHHNLDEHRSLPGSRPNRRSAHQFRSPPQARHEHRSLRSPPEARLEHRFGLEHRFARLWIGGPTSRVATVSRNKVAIETVIEMIPYDTVVAILLDAAKNDNANVIKWFAQVFNLSIQYMERIGVIDKVYENNSIDVSVFFMQEYKDTLKK
jgi:hypothetical protein